MVFNAREFENLRETEEMNAPTDKEKWVSPSYPKDSTPLLVSLIFTLYDPLL